MDNDLKSGLGYLIPIGAIVGYVLALMAENFNLAMILAAGGILLWFIYMLVMEIKPPKPFGNIIVFFGILLAGSVFLATGLEQDIFGGFKLKTEGAIYAIMILFFTIMAGVLFRSMSQKQDITIESQLSNRDRELVEKALAAKNGAAADPRIIVVKQDAPPVKEKPEEEEYDYGDYDPYAYQYPPEYYAEEDDDDDDEEYEDDDEDEEDDR